MKYKKEKKVQNKFIKLIKQETVEEEEEDDDQNNSSTKELVNINETVSTFKRSNLLVSSRADSLTKSSETNIVLDDGKSKGENDIYDNKIENLTWNWGGLYDEWKEEKDIL